MKKHCYKVTLDHSRIKLIWAYNAVDLLLMCSRDYPGANVDIIEQIC